MPPALDIIMMRAAQEITLICGVGHEEVGWDPEVDGGACWMCARAGKPVWLPGYLSAMRHGRQAEYLESSALP